jgi:hypothetical protein
MANAFCVFVTMYVMSMGYILVMLYGMDSIETIELVSKFDQVSVIDPSSLQCINPMVYNVPLNNVNLYDVLLIHNIAFEHNKQLNADILVYSVIVLLVSTFCIAITALEYLVDNVRGSFSFRNLQFEIQ